MQMPNNIRKLQMTLNRVDELKEKSGERVPTDTIALLEQGMLPLSAFVCMSKPKAETGRQLVVSACKVSMKCSPRSCPVFPVMSCIFLLVL